MVLVPDVSTLRPRDAFARLEEAGLQPVLLGLPTAKSHGNLGAVPPGSCEVLLWLD
jgi:hypothetical protein